MLLQGFQILVRQSKLRIPLVLVSVSTKWLLLRKARERIGTGYLVVVFGISVGYWLVINA
jgi:hypothetical protein